MEDKVIMKGEIEVVLPKTECNAYDIMKIYNCEFKVRNKNVVSVCPEDIKTKLEKCENNRLTFSFVSHGKASFAFENDDELYDETSKITAGFLSEMTGIIHFDFVLKTFPLDKGYDSEKNKEAGWYDIKKLSFSDGEKTRKIDKKVICVLFNSYGEKQPAEKPVPSKKFGILDLYMEAKKGDGFKPWEISMAFEIFNSFDSFVDNPTEEEYYAFYRICHRAYMKSENLSLVKIADTLAEGYYEGKFTLEELEKMSPCDVLDLVDY